MLRFTNFQREIQIHTENSTIICIKKSKSRNICILEHLCNLCKFIPNQTHELDAENTGYRVQHGKTK